MAEENQNVETTHVSDQEIHSNSEIPQTHHVEIEKPEESSNTVATAGMVCSIIGLILLFTIIGTRFGFLLLFVGFILGIIGLFKKPRGKARVAVCIPLVVYIAITAISCYIWNSVKTPAYEFKDWAENNLESIVNEENFDNNRFEYFLESELNNIINEKSEDEWKATFDASTGSNFLEKGSYLFFGVFQQSLENALERYNSDEIPNFSGADSLDIIDVDIETTDDEDIDDEEDEDEEIVIEEPKENTGNTKKSETFSQSEKNDIQQILDILD